MKHILIIDDDRASSRLLQLHFRNNGHSVTLADSAESGLLAAREIPPDIIILDIRMPGKTGLEALPEFRELFPSTPVIMITAYHDMDSTIQAMKIGAADYVHKPMDINELDTAVETAMARARADDVVMTFSNAGDVRPRGTNIMVGRSRSMKEVFKTIGLVAPKQVIVSIYGESGTGKELVARAIHNAGANPDGPFVAVNCAALVETLLESDLFGHEKGAFTGAVARQLGKFALAENGTIFLDEVGDLSPAVQAKLLRVLQEREYIPVGGSLVKVSNARVIVATNKELFDLVKQGIYREDLYYRLQVVSLRLPPLRERKEDIPGLIETLLARINRDMRRQVNRLAADVLDAFYAYDWPGNVRELENLLMKSVALCPGETITIDLIPEELRANKGIAASTGMSTTEMSLEQVEKQHIDAVLASTGWHFGQTCKILGVSRPRLRRLIDKYALTCQRPHAVLPKADTSGGD